MATQVWHMAEVRESEISTAAAGFLHGADRAQRSPESCVLIPMPRTRSSPCGQQCLQGPSSRPDSVVMEHLADRIVRRRAHAGKCSAKTREHLAACGVHAAVRSNRRRPGRYLQHRCASDRPS